MVKLSRRKKQKLAFAGLGVAVALFLLDNLIIDHYKDEELDLTTAAATFRAEIGQPSISEGIKWVLDTASVVYSDGNASARAGQFSPFEIREDSASVANLVSGLHADLSNGTALLVHLRWKHEDLTTALSKLESQSGPLDKEVSDDMVFSDPPDPYQLLSLGLTADEVGTLRVSVLELCGQILDRIAHEAMWAKRISSVGIIFRWLFAFFGFACSGYGILVGMDWGRSTRQPPGAGF